MGEQGTVLNGSAGLDWDGFAGRGGSCRARSWGQQGGGHLEVPGQVERSASAPTGEEVRPQTQAFLNRLVRLASVGLPRLPVGAAGGRRRGSCAKGSWAERSAGALTGEGRQQPHLGGLPTGAWADLAEGGGTHLSPPRSPSGWNGR